MMLLGLHVHPKRILRNKNKLNINQDMSFSRITRQPYSYFPLLLFYRWRNTASWFKPAD